jgi:flavodoxin
MYEYTKVIKHSDRRNTDMAKNLIIYYSRKGENYVNGNIEKLAKGNTEICAEYIQKAVGGDLFEIKTVTEYGESYRACVEEAKKEWQENARPELKTYLKDIAAYDNIYVCGPCWCGTYPMAVFTQLEKLDFTGRKVMGLMTHEGSGLGSSEQGLKKACNGAIFGTSLAIHGAEAKASEQKIAEWAVRSIG